MTSGFGELTDRAYANRVTNYASWFAAAMELNRPFLSLYGADIYDIRGANAARFVGWDECDEALKQLEILSAGKDSFTHNSILAGNLVPITISLNSDAVGIVIKLDTLGWSGCNLNGQMFNMDIAFGSNNFEWDFTLRNKGALFVFFFTSRTGGRTVFVSSSSNTVNFNTLAGTATNSVSLSAHLLTERHVRLIKSHIKQAQAILNKRLNDGFADVIRSNAAIANERRGHGSLSHYV
jgi:hypothetical protein